MTEPLRMPPDEFALVKKVAAAMGVDPVVPMTPEQHEEFSRQWSEALKEAERNPQRYMHRPLPRQSLTADEIRQLLRECVTVVRDNETLVIRVSMSLTQGQVDEYQRTANDYYREGFIPFRVVVVQGEELAVAEAQA